MAWPANGYTDWATYPAFYSKPLIITDMGCPQFKTHRRLAGRALAADTFSRSEDDMTAHGTWWPGFGTYHHKDGYNVLYGDYHAQWYGDPEERIIWFRYGPWTNGQEWDGTGSSYSWDRVATAGGNNVDAFSSNTSNWHISNKYTSGRAAIWHLFDMAAQRDVGNTPLPQ